MKSNELRIGNLIRYTNEKDLNRGLRGTVLCVDIDTLMYVENNSRADFYEPIPITPEIIEKCGFVFKGGDFYTINDVISFSYDPGCGIYATWIIRDNPMNQVKYLHQLQNLYFALTGEELTVNL